MKHSGRPGISMTESRRQQPRFSVIFLAPLRRWPSRRDTRRIPRSIAGRLGLPHENSRPMTSSACRSRRFTRPKGWNGQSFSLRVSPTVSSRVPIGATRISTSTIFRRGRTKDSREPTNKHLQTPILPKNAALAYVAMTRAKNALFLTSPAKVRNRPLLTSSFMSEASGQPPPAIERQQAW